MAPTTRSRSAAGQHDKENAVPPRPRAKPGQKPAGGTTKKRALGENSAQPRAPANRTKARLTQHEEGGQPIGHDVSGQYRITAPYITTNWPTPDRPFTLRLAPSSTGRHVWGSFYFGIVSGILRGGAAPMTISETWEFEWRGNEEGEGGIVYPWSEDAAMRGSLTFLGGGRIGGTMEGDFLPRFDFTGRKLKAPVVTSKAVKGWKGAWRKRNWCSFEVMQQWKEECAVHGMRGGPDFDMCDEGPAGSDTSAGED